MDSFIVNVVMLNGLVYDYYVKIVVVKIIDGEIGILLKYVLIIVLLVIDEVCIKWIDLDIYVDWVVVNGGIMEVCDNVVFIIVDSVECE